MAEEKAAWSILTYIAAHNNLDELGERSLQQILAVGSSPAVKHAVLYDGTKRAARYLVEGPYKATVEEKDHFDSGDGDALLDTIEWAFKHHPAEHYGLILWSHGSGWRPEELEEIAKAVRQDEVVNEEESRERAAAPGGLVFFRSTVAEILGKEEKRERAICFDDGSGHSLDTLELARVMRKTKTMINQPLDLLGMDACLMANLEVAYEVRDAVRYLVASEELVPGLSWPYDQIYNDLGAYPAQTPAAFAQAIVHSYADFYHQHPPTAGDVTKVALDLSLVSVLANAVDVLSQALLSEMDTHGDLLWEVQKNVAQRETRMWDRRPHKFNYHLWDIGSLSKALAAHKNASDAVRLAASGVCDALAQANHFVLAERHLGDWFDDIGGVTIYMIPPKKLRVAPVYSSVALAQDTAWNEMLSAYHEHFPPM